MKAEIKLILTIAVILILLIGGGFIYERLQEQQQRIKRLENQLEEERNVSEKCVEYMLERMFVGLLTQLKTTGIPITEEELNHYLINFYQECGLRIRARLGCLETKEGIICYD